MNEPWDDRPGDMDPLIVRAWKVFVSPGEVFRALAREPRVPGAILLGAGLVALAGLAVPLEVYEEGLRTQILEMGGDLPADPAVMARLSKVGAIFGAFLIWPLMAVLSAGVLALVLLFGFGYEGTFRQYLAVTAHAFLVAAVGALVLVPLKIVTSDPGFTISLGHLFFFLEEGWAARFLGYMDLFNLWAFTLVGIGASMVDGERPAGPAIGVGVGIIVLLAMAVAAVTG